MFSPSLSPMKSSFLRLLTSAAVALAISATVSFAQETSPEKKDGEKSPCCPTEAPKSEIFNHCGSCGKKEEPTTAPATAPATEPAKTEPVKQEECPEKKDGEKCPAAPSEAPKA